MRDELFTEAATVRPLRDYQSTAIDRLRASLARGRKRPVLMAPTGAGKTRIAAEIISLARAKNKRVAFCVPSLMLIDQTIQAFWDEGVREIGVVQRDHHMTDSRQPVQVCSIQTLERREFPDVDLVIPDECHEIHKCMIRWMEKNPSVPFVGLSATPWARGMAKHYDDLIVVETTKGLIERGYLTPFRAFAPSHPDMSGVKVIAGEYHEGQASEVMRNEKLVGDVVEHWIKHAENRPTIVFAVDCAHAQALQDQFVNAGVPCGYQDAKTTDGERAIIRDHFRDRRLKVVTSVGTLIRGVDWDVRCIVDAQPTKSDIRHVQKIGRGLRPADGKEDLLILDHANNSTTLGMVDEIFHAALDDGTRTSAEKQARESKPAVPSECAKCHRLRPARVHVCPHCGFAPQRQSTVHHEDGELQELRPKVSGKRVSDKTIRLQGKEKPLAQFMGELRQFASTHGYKPGWAAWKYKTATGSWPKAVRDAPLCAVSPEVVSWIKASQIRFAKSKSNPRNQANV
jgi:DNA repair protein RadD